MGCWGQVAGANSSVKYARVGYATPWPQMGFAAVTEATIDSPTLG